MNLERFTVIWIDRIKGFLEHFNCFATDTDHAQVVCEDNFHEADVIWVNQGHNNLSMNYLRPDNYAPV